MDWTRHVAVAAIALAVLTGCEEPDRRTDVGIVRELSDGLQVGDRAPGFDFHRGDGKRVRFDNVRGDVTIVAITGAVDPNVCSIAGNILLLAEQYSGIDTDVKYLCVSEPEGDTCNLQANIVEKCGLKSMHVIGLCDAGGRVKRLFRTKVDNVYFVIGGDDRIAAKGQLDNLRSLEEALRKAVRKYEQNLPPMISE
jgi:hypothetical protein